MEALANNLERKVAGTAVTIDMVVLRKPEPIRHGRQARRTTPKAKRRTRMTHAQLLAMAKTHRPPQKWFEETEDPTRPN
jgi:hypothetical protein